MNVEIKHFGSEMTHFRITVPVDRRGLRHPATASGTVST
jgi:hypothetical protein